MEARVVSMYPSERSDTLDDHENSNGYLVNIFGDHLRNLPRYTPQSTRTIAMSGILLLAELHLVLNLEDREDGSMRDHRQ